MQPDRLSVFEATRHKITSILRAETEIEADQATRYLEGYISALVDTDHLVADQFESLQSEINDVRARWGHLSAAQHTSILNLERAYKELRANGMITANLGGDMYVVVAESDNDAEAVRMGSSDAFVERMKDAFQLDLTPDFYVRA